MFGLFTANLFARLLLLGCALGLFVLVLGLFLGETFCGPTFDFSLGPRNGPEAIFATLQLGGNIQTIGLFTVIGLFGLTEQVCDLGLELDFKLVGVFPAQCPVFGRIGLDLGAVETDFAEFQAAHLLGDQENLNKQWLQ